MSLDFADDQSTLVQVMAWCCQATSHYLNQCLPRSLSPYDVAMPQCVTTIIIWSSSNATDGIPHKPIFSACYYLCSFIFLSIYFCSFNWRNDVFLVNITVVFEIHPHSFLEWHLLYMNIIQIDAFANSGRYQVEKVTDQFNSPYPGFCIRVLILRPADACSWTKSSLVQVMASRRFGAKPLPKQCWRIVNWSLQYKLQCNFNKRT